MGRRIEVIAFERERIVKRSVPDYCPACNNGSQLLSASQAAAIAEVELRTIHRWLADDRVHGATTTDGHYRVCKSSLQQLTDPFSGGESHVEKSE